MRLITEKHIRGYWVRVRENLAAALSFEQGCSAEGTPPSCHLSAVAAEPIPFSEMQIAFGTVT